MTAKRQFIAGVQCPGCGRLDKVQRCRDGERVWMECIACGLVRTPDDSPEPSGSGRIPVKRQE